MWTVNFQMFKPDLEKAEEPEIKLPTSVESLKKQGSSRKTSTSALLTTPKPFTVWITTNCGKFLNRWEYQTTLPAFWEICMPVKKQQLEPNMEQWTDTIESTDAEAEVPILWPPDGTNWLIEKDPDAGKDWRQKKNGAVKDEVVR